MDDEIKFDVSIGVLEACNIICEAFNKEKVSFEDGLQACLEITCSQLLMRKVLKEEILKLVESLCDEMKKQMDKIYEKKNV